MSIYFSSESVCKGHPDKVCDIIADTILDEAISINPDCHNAVEVTIKDNTVLVYGETDTLVDYVGIVKETLKSIGYGDEFEIILRVSEQSGEINSAVEDREDTGAGDQGIIFGYACNETKECMPLSIMLAHELARTLDSISSSDILPDGKTQITVAYDDNSELSHIDTILVSKQHSGDIPKEELERLVMSSIINAVANLGVGQYFDDRTRIIINPSGSFTIGGPWGDSGTTGRKIVVDTYGGYGRVGGGCFSSKDPTKVDRSAAYYARYVAKNIVAHNLADKCEIQVAYGIGIAEPISVFIDCFGTNKVTMNFINEYVKSNFNFCPSNMIAELGLKRPIYGRTAVYGHFGNPEYPWEQIKD